jgi:TolB-like protein
MGVDEEKTLAVLENHRRELIDPLIHQHRGRIFKTTGDGMLIEFASVVDAVRCAVVMQRGMEDRNANLQETERIRFRIGINLGDVMVDEGDMFGDGVNVAARIEALSAPGEICVSASVREQVGEKLPIGFADFGEHGVKNIARPVRVYRVEKSIEPLAGAADDRGTAPLALPEDGPSVAVLPFANMSGDSEQEYFVDGIVEDIITGLSRIKWLHVIARNSAFVYKGRAVDVKQVGRDLGVRYVLEGSLRKAGNRVRLTAQLIEAGSGRHVWAERYDPVILGHAGRTAEAVDYAERALRWCPLDRTVNLPYVGLGIAYCAAGNWEAAIPACGKSEQANPRFSLPYFLRAAALSQLGRIEEAKVAARRGLELEPGFSVSGFVRAHTGRAEIWEPIGDALRRLGLLE